MDPEHASRVAWALGLASILMTLTSLAIMFRDRNVRLPGAVASYGWSFSEVLSVVSNLGLPVIGILLASKRPENRLGWLFLALGLTVGLNDLSAVYGAHALVVGPVHPSAGRVSAWIGGWVGAVSLGLVLFVFLLFPTGRLPAPRWRAAAWFVGATSAWLTASLLITSTQSWSDPYGSVSGDEGLVGLLSLAVIVGSLAVCATAVVMRFRRSRGDERLQLKWFVVATLFLLTMLSIGYSFTVVPPAVSIVQSIAGMFFGVSIAVAVLRYRLYGIDVVINKAVIYGVLAAFFTLVYVAIVVGIGTAVGSARNPLLTLLAAVVIALAFNPVRDRAKRLANTIAYGKRATPYEVLSEFAEGVAATYSLDEVLPRTAQMLAHGTGAVRADVWLRVASHLVDEASWPEGAPFDDVPIDGIASPEIPGASLSAPVVHQGEMLGALSIMKGPGDPSSALEAKLLADVASQAGLVLRNIRLIEDLKASRQRIVAAQDEERRRIERNIHDGAQQQLVALSVKQHLLELTLKTDPAKAAELAAQLQQDTSDALENLRDLARGIYPPLLADKGLLAALQAQARKSAVPTTVEGDGIGRYPPEAEGAVYFCTLEALQNVAKYAEASRATVRLSSADGHLSFSIQDDGIGFDPGAKGYGTGMQGMADRLAALGGMLSVASASGEGTLITGTLPARAVDRDSNST